MQIQVMLWAGVNNQVLIFEQNLKVSVTLGQSLSNYSNKVCPGWKRIKGMSIRVKIQLWKRDYLGTFEWFVKKGTI